MYPEFLWADQYIHQTHEDSTMVGTDQTNFKNLCLQILLKCTPWHCLFLDFFLKHFPNYLSLHYQTLFFLDDFKNFIYSNKKLASI